MKSFETYTLHTCPSKERFPRLLEEAESTSAKVAPGRKICIHPNAIACLVAFSDTACRLNCTSHPPTPHALLLVPQALA